MLTSRDIYWAPINRYYTFADERNWGGSWGVSLDSLFIKLQGDVSCDASPCSLLLINYLLRLYFVD